MCMHVYVNVYAMVHCVYGNILAYVQVSWAHSMSPHNHVCAIIHPEHFTFSPLVETMTEAKLAHGNDIWMQRQTSIVEVAKLLCPVPVSIIGKSVC